MTAKRLAKPTRLTITCDGCSRRVPRAMAYGWWVVRLRAVMRGIRFPRDATGCSEACLARALQRVMRERKSSMNT